ncbi:transposase [Phaeobacter sp. JH20_30]|uniref:transposase n=2 Tax=unclassified Phaeobacter TaxID=2621772 RepID=UPI003A86F5CF
MRRSDSRGRLRGSFWPCFVMASGMTAPDELPDDIAELKAIIRAQQDQNARLEALVASFKKALFGTKSEKIDPAQYELELEDIETAFATMRSLAMRFNGIMRGRQADPLPAWIDDAIETDLVPIMRFARTLNRDFDAVKNAIEMPWSNGQAEGQINRLKTLKRAMYGRAGPALLRARMLPFRHTD